MGVIEINKKRVFSILLVWVFLYILISFYSGSYAAEKYPVSVEPILPASEDEAWDDPLTRVEHAPKPAATPVTNHDQLDTVVDSPDSTSQPAHDSPTAPVYNDAHPVTLLMKEADKNWREYENSRSQSFRETVSKYRSKYGRHPPPGFKEWYMFARMKNVWNIDDFDHVMDDLRPFWAIEPRIIRTHAAHMWENGNDGVSGIHIRNGNISRISNTSWRAETMIDYIRHFVKYLPDMDIAMNRLDQPRLLVPWEDLQTYLDEEYKSRVMHPEVSYNFTEGQDRLTNLNLNETERDETEERFDAEWFGHPGKQYMDIASKACPPESPARSDMSIAQANLLYKEPSGGIVTNFNLSTDLCTVGPAVQNLHGMLYSPSSIQASHKLVPIFSECKVNVNNDIMFPANMYWKHDDRYDYNAEEDVPWRQKEDKMIWRGVTSGGAQVADNWQTMHRQRLVQLMNGTYQKLMNNKVAVLAQDPSTPGFRGSDFNMATNSLATYHNTTFDPSSFADKISDIGFVQAWGCIPNCSFYDDVFAMKEQTTLTKQFRSKYLIDVDGHSFSGRWHAFLQSRSLGFKATIFREWHDSRLFAWRHFVPVDNRYDDLYSLLTYFAGYGNPPREDAGREEIERNVFIPPHPKEAKLLARQGREWAHKVLRRDDIEVYMYRLLLEYGRIIDDNRDRIGYSGDGTELDQFDANAAFDGDDLGSESSASKWGIGGWLGGLAKADKNKEDKKPSHVTGVGVEDDAAS